jgi:protein-disulfide isomerase
MEEEAMAFDLNRAANVATVVVACCAVAAAVSHLRGAERGAGGTRPSDGPDTAYVADWENYLIGGHARGPENAALTILEFGDYECPFCTRFAATSQRILAAYPEQVRLVYRHWPLPNHRFAYPAARAAECAGEQDRFWEYHDLLYENADSLGLVPFTDLAVRAGVPDVSKYEQCTRRSTPVPAIEAGIRDAAAAGGSGTPTIIVNGVRYRRGIDSALVAALLEKGAQK